MPRIEVPLCRLDDLADGEARGFDPLGQGCDTLFIVRRGERLYAWRDACPHQRGTPMAWRKNAYLNADRSRIVCSAHGALFDIESGVCTLGPCVGQSLTAVRIALAADGTISARLDGLTNGLERPAMT
jgi:nitrite reductase/ring-hydroxylating ferredoxin subunit